MKTVTDYTVPLSTALSSSGGFNHWTGIWNGGLDYDLHSQLMLPNLG